MLRRQRNEMADLPLHSTNPTPSVLTFALFIAHSSSMIALPSRVYIRFCIEWRSSVRAFASPGSLHGIPLCGTGLH